MNDVFALTSPSALFDREFRYRMYLCGIGWALATRAQTGNDTEVR